jgi:FKBP-type peptidyl-prolyl cis-trans isomerase FkpA
MRFQTSTAAALAMLVAACGGDRPAESGPDWSDPAAIDYAPELGVDIGAMTRTDSGLYYRDTREGDGAVARPGDTAVVHYTGFFPDGRSFDSSRSGAPFEFALGQGRVIRGWDEGVAGMQVGSVRKLVIPPSLAYGAEGAGGVIPPNATLVFDVELLELR